MPSPFPGMNPYLEGPSLWEDFHANLAAEIQAQLTPRLRPRYFAALVPRVTYDEIVIETSAGTIKPDVSVIKATDRPLRGGAATIAPAPMTGAVAHEVPVRLFTVEIRETGSNTPVTAIEILSPVNKRPGHEAFESYAEKRRTLMRSTVNLIEVDLLRRGQRFPTKTPLPAAPYFVFVHRGRGSPSVDIWPILLSEPIPVVPVPLLAPDPDQPLDLTTAVGAIYDRASYDLRIDYARPPPKPDLPAEELSWLEKTLQQAGVR